MRHCVTMKIQTALDLSDDELIAMFNQKPDELRASLKKDLENGELLIGSYNCEGFNPVTGCPGHND